MSFLADIVVRRRRDVRERMRLVPLEMLQAKLEARLSENTAARSSNAPAKRDFGAALRTGSLAVIAEFKRSSPSGGEFATREVADVAQAYERGGAAAISVLTEPSAFAGRLDDIATARSACSLPVLCKDFIVEEYQVLESAAAGADALLLIVAVLEQKRLTELRALAEALGMYALVEVHSEAEAQRALEAGAHIIGINNRDLHTLETDRSTALRVRPVLPAHTTVVAESGYQRPEDLAECAAAGFDAVLVGEALLRSANPEAALRSLRGVPA